MRKHHLVLDAFGFLTFSLLPFLFYSPAVSQNDSAVMQKLKKSIKIPSTLDWSDPNPCKWSQVLCNGERVERIQIGGRDLTGFLPPDLNNLTQLVVFEVMQNQLSGPLPTLSGLSALKTFNCIHNNFSSIPTDFFTGLTSLEKVYLDYNPFQSWKIPSNVAELISLQELSANGANIAGTIPDFLDKLTGLQNLHLAMNYLEGGIPMNFANSSIKSLWLNGQQSTYKLNGTLHVLGYMNELTEVWLHGNKFTGPIPELGNLISLQNFSVRDNMVTGPVPASLLSLSTLVTVNLTNNYLQGPTPKFPSSVTVDMIDNTNRFCVDVPGVQCDSRVTVLLSILKSLDYPYVLAYDWKGNDPCSDWTEIICNASGNITVINFQNKIFYGTISANFSLISSLQKLILAGNHLYGPIPNDLTTLPNLNLFDVSNNNISGKVPSFRPDVQVKVDGNPNIGKDIPLPDTPPGSNSVGSDNKNPVSGKIIGSVIGVICGLCIIGLGVFFYGRKRKLFTRVDIGNMLFIPPRHDSGDQNDVKRNMIQSSGTESHTKSSGASNIHVGEYGNRVMSIQLLRNVTSNFSEENILGKGGFATVYKGEMDNGTKIAVKRMESAVKNDKNGLAEFMSEVNVLSKVRHRHLVSLVGYCLDENERLLVYEHMPLGTLSRYLFNWKQENLKPLDWKTRLTIALDVARGVEYLHELAQQSFIHRDLKPSNILLGDDMRAKVADFGLVRLAPEGINSVETKLAGTFGYLAPEYAVTGRVTTKIDVYSFGVILMEMITGRKALDNNQPEESCHLSTWFRRMHLNEDTFYRAIDKAIEDNGETLSSISSVADLACHCTARDPHQRPDMGHVVNILSSSLAQWNPAQTESDHSYSFDCSMDLHGTMEEWKLSDRRDFYDSTTETCH